MKTIQNILLCAPFFGLFAVALPGCPSESAGQSPAAPEAAPEEVICDKLAECGDLGEGVTVEQCAADIGQFHGEIVQAEPACTQVVEQFHVMMACMAQQGSCGEGGGDASEDDASEGNDIPEDHPCFDESESFDKAYEEAKQQKPAAGLICVLPAVVFVRLAATPATGVACTTDDECPEVACGTGLPLHFCHHGRCKTADDLCE
ncbi:hypothetical protein [Sorangium sp. So ce887]|uniref:hypothetical protein n=1 Tax=Sorangium sp. So ce887 TaxID=3133324 RepID=UPI003F629452